MIHKSQKQKVKELGDILERHHKGTLPKSYYAKNGRLYPHALLYGQWKSKSQKIDEKKDRAAWEKAEYKLKTAPIVKKSEELKPPKK